MTYLFTLGRVFVGNQIWGYPARNVRFSGLEVLRALLWAGGG
jgi:hypothetical protein